MQRPGPKRQIIKTRSQRPYIVARIVLLLIILAAIAVMVILSRERTHGSQTGFAAPPAVSRKEGKNLTGEIVDPQRNVAGESRVRRIASNVAL